MFKAVQWARTSDAASSLAQMAARTAAGNDALGQIVRERQDLVGEWQSKDMLLTAARSEPPAARNAAAEQALTARLGAIDGRLAEVDKGLARDFAGYSAFARPEPISVEEVQALLHPDEALALFLDTPAWKPTPEETFIWVVTKTDLRWVRSGLGTRALTEQVAALRCGLDANAWRGDRCPELLKSSYTAEHRASGKPLPFDTGRALALYQALFSPAEDLIKGKHPAAGGLRPADSAAVPRAGYRAAGWSAGLRQGGLARTASADYGSAVGGKPAGAAHIRQGQSRQSPLHRLWRSPTGWRSGGGLAGNPSKAGARQSALFRRAGSSRRASCATAPCNQTARSRRTG
jgi:hypothetical protein